MTNRFTVKINSWDYTLITDKTKEEFNDIADYVHDKLANVGKNNKSLNYEQKSILAMFTIVDELMEVKDENENLVEKIKDTNADYPMLKTKYDKIIKIHNSLLNREVEHISTMRKQENKINELEDSLEKSNKEKENLKKDLKNHENENKVLKMKIEEMEKKIKNNE